jgi:hypothetical protein
LVSAIEVCDRVRVDKKKELGDHLMALKKSGQVDIITMEFISGPFQILSSRLG